MQVSLHAGFCRATGEEVRSAPCRFKTTFSSVLETKLVQHSLTSESSIAGRESGPCPLSVDDSGVFRCLPAVPSW